MAPEPDQASGVVKKRPPIADNTTKAISVYFESKKAQENVIKRYPEWDVLKGEPLLELMRVSREFRDAETEWVTKRVQYENRRKENDRQWEELREKEKELRLNFVNFDTFIKDNRHKRERAKIKIKDQKELQKIRESEIAELEKTLEKLENIRSRMRDCVEEYGSFKQYLELVVDSTDFNSISAVFNRYETLIDVKKTLHRNHANSLRMLENTSVQLQKMTEERSQNLMDLNSRLAHLQSRHGRARSQTLHWEMMVSRIKELAGRRETDVTLVRACIWNLYKQICVRKDVPVEAKYEDLEEQLIMIKRTITELNKIVCETKRRVVREKKFAARERGGSEVNVASRLDTRSSFRSSFKSSAKNSCNHLSIT